MPVLPTGTVTFLFTDIEGSTGLLQRAAEAYRHLLAIHHGILRDAITAAGGVEVQTDGDAFFAVFPTAPGALRAAVQAQRALSAHPWPEGHEVRVRMGVHTGEGIPGGENYIGLDVHRAARIAAAGHGGQVLISGATRALVENVLPPGVGLRDLGPHRLKDVEQPEHLHELVIGGLPDEFPPIRTLDARQTNLPLQRTSFVGREREVAEVTAVLRGVRLLTLTGPGGIGKTRLALKVAAEELGRFADGVYVADLSPITDAGQVPAAIARALLLREQPGREPIETLADHLRDRELLLVLDNLEQIIEGATVVGRLLDVGPRLVVLATSRVPLHVAGEREFPVPPLALPGADEAADVDRLSRYEAVRLFVERATAVRPGFRLTRENAAAIGQITVQLDGRRSRSSLRPGEPSSCPRTRSWDAWERGSACSRAGRAISPPGNGRCAPRSNGRTTSSIPRSSACSPDSPRSAAAGRWMPRRRYARWVCRCRFSTGSTRLLTRASSTVSTM